MPRNTRNEIADNNAVHTTPPIARFANGVRVSGGSVTADVSAIEMT
jgi:hypothetical protein